MQVAVIGGFGHLGAAVVHGLRAAGLEVAIAGRSARSDVQVDLTRPDTFAALDRFDAIVNCSDSVAAPPDDLIAYCLEHEALLLETASEPVALRRVIERYRNDPGRHRGTVLLGAGIFPGFSNLLAAEAIAGVPDCNAVELGIRWSPFSGGGAGMVRLVPHLLVVPTQRVEAGQLVEGPAMGPGPELPFPDGTQPSLHLAFVEPTMIALRHPELREVATYGSFEPNLINRSFRLFPLWLMQRPITRLCLWIQFTVLRRFLLRRRTSHVLMVVRARNAAGDEAIRHFTAPDGIAMAGHIVAAMLLELDGPSPGLYVPPDLLDAEAIRRRLG